MADAQGGEPASKKAREAGTEHLRFDMGARVACNTGDWSPGIVVKHNYREPNWPAGKIAPYQIQLDDGRLIFAPVDDDRVIRLHDGAPPPDTSEVPDSEKIPVTIITGFLGAGKTTLVNYILTSKEHGMRICVIENEFGAVNIDENLVSENLRTNEDIISMDNGCVCCTVRGDLVRALKELAKRKDTFDTVIIETTGLADPAPVCFTFNTEPTIERIFRVDGILTLVDAKHVEEHLEAKTDGSDKEAVNEAVQQVAFADRILLNKIDLVSKEDVKRVKATIRSINAYAEVIETQQSQIDLKKILDLQAFNLERVQEIDPDWEPESDEEGECVEEGCTQDHDHGHGHGHEHGEACKDEGCTQDHSHDHGHASHDHGDSHSHGSEAKAEVWYVTIQY